MPCIGVINQYKMKKERRQSLNYHFSYRGSSDFKYDVVNDMFINKMVTQRRIPKNTGRLRPGRPGLEALPAVQPFTGAAWKDARRRRPVKF